MSDYQVGRMHDGERYAVIVYATGRKLITWASIDSPLGLHTGPLSDERYITPLPDYPVSKAARKMLKAARKLGTSKGAGKFLKGALS